MRIYQQKKSNPGQVFWDVRLRKGYEEVNYYEAQAIVDAFECVPDYKPPKIEMHRIYQVSVDDDRVFCDSYLHRTCYRVEKPPNVKR